MPALVIAIVAVVLCPS
uniref:Uncharacterized protein n=1 Tax=Rhizophora mucronata TaxID=61149 RepID=A0A2P2KXH6_RHIMU